MQQFNFHSHTYRCGHADFDYTDEEYVLDYIKQGFKRIAFTDHAPEKQIIDKRPHVRMGYEQRHEYYSSIKKLKEKYKDQIEIQSGFEVEYLPDQVENIMELKSETDKLILGQHFVYDKNEKDLVIFGRTEDWNIEDMFRYGEYLKQAMELHIPDIIAHPDICFRHTEEFGEEEEKITRTICETAEKTGIPLEINLNGVAAKTYFKDKKLNEDSFETQIERLAKVGYPNTDFWKIASEYDIKVVYGLDTHYRGYIGKCEELMKLANIKIGEDVIAKLNFVQDMK